MLRLHGAIFCAHATQFVALDEPEILHHVAMNKFRAIQKKIFDLILFFCRILQHIFVLHVVFFGIAQYSHPWQQIFLT